MNGWQSWIESIEPYVRRVESWPALLPARMTPLQSSLLVTGVFLAISLFVMLAGRMLIGWGRNRLPEAEQVGSRRPLILGPLTEAFAWLWPVSDKKQAQLRGELVSAGYFHRKALEEYLGFRNAAALAWLVFSGCVVVMLANPQENLTPQILVGSAIVLGCMLSIPRIVLNLQSDARRNRIRYSLPDSLDLINMMVTGGMPLRQAIQKAQRELRRVHPDMACELAIIEHQAQSGSMDLALRQFATRVNVPDVTVLATMVRHAEQLGGNVSNAFREFADSIRRTRRQTAEERGAKGSVKLLFPTVLCLTPPIYILLLGPSAIELKTFIYRENQPGGVLSQGIQSDLKNVTRPIERGPEVPAAR